MRACPSDDQLWRALRGMGDRPIVNHIANCIRCRATRERLRDDIELAKRLPIYIPDESTREETRARLLATAARSPAVAPRRSLWALGLAVIAVAAASAVSYRTGRHRVAVVPASYVTINAGVGARYTIESPPPWETIRLREGTVDLDVSPLQWGDRVRVEVADGEVEVRGTRFQVTAVADHLTGVDVTHGRVEVRPIGAPMTVLTAGQHWRVAPVAPPTIAEASAVEPPASPLPSRQERPRRIARRSAAEAERVLHPTHAEALYDDAWDALRARRFGEASTDFGHVLAESPAGPLSDEAAFWRATALARGGNVAEAVAAFRQYLAEHDRSPRRGEASAILGWLLVETHQKDLAVPLFRAALADPHEAVRRSATEGLSALAPAPAH